MQKQLYSALSPTDTYVSPQHLLCANIIARAGTQHSLMKNRGVQMVSDWTMARFYDGAKAFPIL